MGLLGRLGLVWLGCGLAMGQQGASAGRAETAMAATVMKQWPAGVISTLKKPGEWGYEEGVLLDGMAAEWEVSHDPKVLAYIQASVDRFVGTDGTIRMAPGGKAFPIEEHQLDHIEMGRAILFLYRQTKDPRYAAAAKFLHEALEKQPRTASGGYWHKTIYPNQIWLDGAYMAEPFRAEYAGLFGVKGDFADIAKQFLLMRAKMYDPHSELLRHGWDESKKMPWADPKTGLSPEVWARAMGWYCMALVDVLDWFPKNDPARGKLVGLLHQTLMDVGQYQDLESGLWWQVMTKGPQVTGTIGPRGEMVYTVNVPAAKGNYLEASASEMFCYTLAKSLRMGYFDGTYSVGTVRLKAQNRAFEKDVAKAWDGIQAHFVRVAEDGTVTLSGTVKAAGLGGTPYRSGTYEYYVGEPVGDQDAKGVGAYLLAGSEVER